MLLNPEYGRPLMERKSEKLPGLPLSVLYTSTWWCAESGDCVAGGEESPHKSNECLYF